MKVRCPKCKAEIFIQTGYDVEDIQCGACGAKFSIERKEEPQSGAITKRADTKKDE